MLTPAFSLCSLRMATMRPSTSALKTASLASFARCRWISPQKVKVPHLLWRLRLNIFKTTSYMGEFHRSTRMCKAHSFWPTPEKCHEKSDQKNQSIRKIGFSELKYLAHCPTSLCPASWKWTLSTFSSIGILLPKHFSKHPGGGRWMQVGHDGTGFNCDNMI